MTNCASASQGNLPVPSMRARQVLAFVRILGAVGLALTKYADFIDEDGMDAESVAIEIEKLQRQLTDRLTILDGCARADDHEFTDALADDEVAALNLRRINQMAEIATRILEEPIEQEIQDA